MKTFLKTALFTALTFHCFFSYSQHQSESVSREIKCVSDEIHRKLLNTDPDYRRNVDQFEINIQRLIQENSSGSQGAVPGQGSTAGAVYTIPLVFHVIHLGEAEGVGTNVPFITIQQAISGLNDRFRNIIGNGADIELQFCLATRDPLGNATTGINRINGSGVPNYSTGGVDFNSSCPTSADEYSIKNLSVWPNTEYYNVWVVNTICSGSWGGYAYFPGASASVDGTVIGMSQLSYNGHSFAHELGHAFNLFHTFEGDNDNANCPPDFNCLTDGDRICDTPPHKKNDCGPLNPCTASGVWDNSRFNYMSYCSFSWPAPSTSYGRFTLDQRDRMRATLSGTSRAALLSSLGCSSGTPTYCIGLTNFTSCTGSFTDGSGSNDYNDNTDCMWLIQPFGATSISLDFTSFSTQAGFDSVSIYDGTTTAAPLLGAFSGTSLPPTVVSTGGSMLVHFTSNGSVTAPGWDASYTCNTGTPTYCNSMTTLTACSGSFSDGSGLMDYLDFTDCKWLIQPAGATYIMLNFTSFNTEWGYDYVSVYDGATTAAPLLGTFAGFGIPPTLYSTGGSMLVHFTSDGSVTYQGWDATYTCSTSPLPYCIGTTSLTACNGSFSDGSGANNYNDNSDCKWLIQPFGATSITLDFTAFNTETGNDLVSVYDGTTTAAPLLGAFSGTSLPSSVTSTGGSMLVHFTSNGSVTAPGWNASYTCNTLTPTYCTGTTTLSSCSGTFSDGSGVSNYLDNTDCYWLIQPAGATYITLNFSSFQTEAGYDFVTVYDGSTTAAPLLGSYSGFTLPPTIFSTGGSMLVHFYSDGSVTAPGWDANYNCSTTPLPYCVGLSNLTNCAGFLSDGSGINDYYDNSDCMWLIQPFGATSITLNFSYFYTELGFDFVRVYDGATVLDPLLGVFSGTNLPPALISSGGSMLVHFTTDGSVTAPGWDANYTCSTGTPTYCSGITNIVTCSGTVTDGSGINNYLDNSDCKWLIQPAGATSVTLTFSAFELESGWDYVYVYDGPTTASPLLGSYTGITLPPVLTSTGGSMLIHFTTDGSVTMQGWAASYSCVSLPPTYCSGTVFLTTCSGNFTDGSGINNYLDYSDCKWLIQPAGATSVTLTFSAFELESGWDYVNVYDGPTTASPLLGSYTGATIPPVVISTGGIMLVHFTTDGSVTMQGWAASYNCSMIPVTYCSGTVNLTACNGNFSDGSGANDYINNSDCKWLIQPAGASSITLNFSAFNTEPGFDFVSVYDGTTTAAPLLGSYSGFGLPPTLSSTGGSMLVHFTTDGSVIAPGWDASYTCCTVPPQPGTISGNSPVCRKSSQNYSVSPVTGATSYTWTLPAGWSGSSNSASITAIVGNTGGTIRVTANNSCGSSTQRTFAVSTSGADTSVSVSGITLTSNASPATYQWVTCPSRAIISGQTSQAFTPSLDGSYAVIVNHNGCTDTSNCHQITGVGIEDRQPYTISVFPNPTSGLLIVKCTGLTGDNFKIVLTNTLGQTLTRKEFTVENNSADSQIDVSELPSGMYFLTVNSNKISQVFKIQKQ